MVKELKAKILELLKKEFWFDRIDEETGKKEEDHEYRGFTLWLKEIVESAIGIGLIIFSFCFFIFLLYRLIPNVVELEPLDFIKFSRPYLKLALSIAGGVLILDSLLLVAALISSPGIDETIDSISVSLAGVLILLLGQYADDLIEKPTIIYVIIAPLALMVIALIITKHVLKKHLKGRPDDAHK